MGKSTNQLLYDAFNMYYKKGMEALDKGEKELAKRNILLASESLLKLSKECEGDLKKNRIKRAEELLRLAEKIEIKAPNLEKNNTVNPKASDPSSKQEDDTETKWSEAEIPNISLNEVAGLDEVKEAINTRIILPRLHPEIFEKFKKKAGGGIMLYGLPGTGKTMVAKAIAHEVKAKFYSVKCSDIVSKWFGEAEQNIKNLFATARKEKTAIIFFDEFEAIGAKRGGSSTVMARIIPELLAQIQGFEENENTLLLLAATNRPWDIDSAFLRPGRFNDPIYVPLPDKEARFFIIQKALEGIPMEDDVSIHDIAVITEGYNSSDVVEFCERAKDNAITKSIQNNGKIHNITKEDILDTAQKVKSSVQKDDLVAMSAFRNSFRH